MTTIPLSSMSLVESPCVAEPTKVFLRPENSYPEPLAGCDGVSFPPVPKRFLIATIVMASGTSPMESQRPLNGLRLVVARGESQDSAARRYRQRRDEIVTSGVPMLDDEELRKEIQERKGIRER